MGVEGRVARGVVGRDLGAADGRIEPTIEGVVRARGISTKGEGRIKGPARGARRGAVVVLVIGDRVLVCGPDRRDRHVGEGDAGIPGQGVAGLRQGGGGWQGVEDGDLIRLLGDALADPGDRVGVDLPGRGESDRAIRHREGVLGRDSNVSARPAHEGVAGAAWRWGGHRGEVVNVGLRGDRIAAGRVEGDVVHIDLPAGGQGDTVIWAVACSVHTNEGLTVIPASEGVMRFCRSWQDDGIPALEVLVGWHPICVGHVVDTNNSEGDG